MEQAEGSSGRKEVFRALKFTLISLTAGAVEAVSFTVFNEFFHWSYKVCYIIALILSVIWNFTINRKVTFHSAANVPLAMLKLMGYYAVFTPLSAYGGDALEKQGWNEYAVLYLMMFINMTTEYIFDRTVVFGKSIDTDKNYFEEK